jgi:hypothetical protein
MALPHIHDDLWLVLRGEATVAVQCCRDGREEELDGEWWVDCREDNEEVEKKLDDICLAECPKSDVVLQRPAGMFAVASRYVVAKSTACTPTPTRRCKDTCTCRPNFRGQR